MIGSEERIRVLYFIYTEDWAGLSPKLSYFVSAFFLLFHFSPVPVQVGLKLYMSNTWAQVKILDRSQCKPDPGHIIHYLLLVMKMM